MTDPAMPDETIVNYPSEGAEIGPFTETYNGILPVPSEQITAWKKQGVDRVRILYTNDLDTVIMYGDDYTSNGMEACNDHMDEIVGVNLVDLSYGIAREETYDLWTSVPVDPDMDEGAFVMFVEGAIDWSMHEDD
jgi:hypothetical protein